MKELGYMIDCSRGQVPRVETIKKYIDILSAFKYTYLMLYTEDIYEMDNHPYFGYMRGRYTKEEFKEIDEYAASKGIELRGCIQTLAHMKRIKRHGPYRDLYDIDNIFLVRDERVYKLIDEMLNAMSNLVTSRKIHIGMDEAWMLGRGRYLNNNGYHYVREIMEYHLARVNEIARKYNFTCYIWADMLMSAYLENSIVKLPDNIIPYIWRYSPIGTKETDKEILTYKKLSPEGLAYAGGVEKWRGFAPHNAYSFASLKEQIISCKKHGVENYLVTAWADCAADASTFSSLPGVFYASVLSRGLKLNKETKQEFYDAVGIKFDDFLHIDDLNRYDQPKSRYQQYINDLSFIHLYNDPLQNLYKEVEGDQYFEFYTKCQITMQKLAKNQEFGYIFKSLQYLARVLKVKSNLAINIEKAYKNKELLPEVIKQGKTVLKYLNEFVDVYEEQWLKEAKGMGYEKQVIRLGGLKERLRFTINLLTKYHKGEIEKIDELEVEHLESNMHGQPVKPGADVVCDYSAIVSAGSLIEL